MGNQDTLGYTIGEEVVTINDGTVLNTVALDRDTFQNPLTMNGGTLAGSGTGNGGGAYSWDAQSGTLLYATSDAGGNPAIISAQTALQSGGTTGAAFSVTRGPDVSGNSPDLIVSGILAEEGGGGNALIITGSNNGGITVFSAPNTFNSATTVEAGILNYQNGTAFGGHSAITVDSGATAQVQGGITGGSLTMTLSGPGDTPLGATGALESVSGSNSYQGPILLGANATISSDSGTLALNGAISDGGLGYGVTTAGTGAIIFTGANSFSGLTTIGAGITSYQNALAWGANSPITVNPGATAQVQGGITSTGTNTLSLSGAGAPNATGALESVNGVNTYSGPIALNADSTVSADSGTLVLAGPISGTPNLTTTGAGLIMLTGSSDLHRQHGGTGRHASPQRHRVDWLEQQCRDYQRSQIHSEQHQCPRQPRFADPGRR